MAKGVSGTLESRIKDETLVDPASAESSRLWVESDEDYEKAKKIVAQNTQGSPEINVDALATALVFVKNFRHSMERIQKSIASNHEK